MTPWPTELRLQKDRKTLLVWFDGGQKRPDAIPGFGNYAVRIVFDYLHSTGIFSWDYLFELGQNRERYWRDYLDELAAKNLSRAPPAR
jgi:DUF971 family protein